MQADIGRVSQVDKTHWSVVNNPKYWGATGGLEYENAWSLGAANGVDDLEALTVANMICNEDGMDPITFGATVGAVMLGMIFTTASMFTFLSQAITGIFLAMYYRPDAAGGAYESVRHINDDVFLGELVHGMHRWGSSMMVILVCLHMARTFFFGAYKYPRELNWVIGVALLILTFIMSFTGYLLPFDQRSFWATVVGNNINGTGPLVGPYLSDFLRAGPDFGATTLSRFYAIHMMLLPGVIGALIGFHLYLVARLGTTAPPWIRAKTPEKLREDKVAS